MEAPEPLPSYLDVVRGIFSAYREFSDSEKYPTDLAAIAKSACSLTGCDLTLLIFLTAFISVIRSLLTHRIYLPFTKSYSVPSARKFCESAFKFKAYLVLWGYSLWVIALSGRYDYFQQPSRMMNFSGLANEEIPGDIRVLYLMQIAFYFHCFYGTLYLDAWRKDSVMMLLHHFLTLCLLYFSFVMKYYKIGSMVLCLHDVSDLFLEATKLSVYLRALPGPFKRLLELFSSLGFVAFAGSWALCRLYWFPLKLVHASNYGNVYYNANGNYPKLWFVLNFMFLTLQLLHVYWFCFILQLLFKILTGKTKSLHDTREYEDDARQSSSSPTEGPVKTEAPVETRRDETPDLPKATRTSELRQRRPPPSARQNGHL